MTTTASRRLWSIECYDLLPEPCGDAHCTARAAFVLHLPVTLAPVYRCRRHLVAALAASGVPL